MSETRKVHLLDPDCLMRDLDRVTQRIWSRCGRIKSWRSTGYVWPRGTSPEDQHRLVADGGVWARLPRQVQCDYCHAIVSWSASRDDILAVSLFCGGLAGCLDATLAALVADPEPSVALDLAEERGLDRPGMWPTVEREWLLVERHEHRWLPWETGDERRALEHRDAPLVPWIRRCTCGVFEHEVAQPFARLNYGARGGKTAAMRAQIAARVAAGERVLYVTPNGSRVVGPGDPLLEDDQP